MSYGTETIVVHKNLRLDKRKGSTNWYARLTLDNGKREVKSTGTDSLDDAKERALKLYYETQARVANKLPASTRKFKAVAEHTIQRMQTDEAAGVGKQAYRDYQQALQKWLIPYFGTTDVAKVDLAALTAFDEWRTKELGRVPAQSTINNHNAALNRVLDEAELRGWITKSLRPTLLNKGVERRCCTTRTVEDSHHESMRLDGLHEQAITRPLPHDELVQLHRLTEEAWVAADLAGQGDDLARAA